MGIKYFTYDELNRLFKAIEINKNNEKHNLRNEAIFKIAYYCALRSSEVGLITVQDFNSLKREMYCKRLKGSFNNTLRIEDKDILNTLKKYVKEYAPYHYMFESQEKKPISRQMLDRLMKKYCNIANIQDKSKWHFHTLKHTRAVVLADMGLDIKEVQYWLGHKNVNNTLIYFQFTSSQQEEMYRKLKRYRDFNR